MSDVFAELDSIGFEREGWMCRIELRSPGVAKGEWGPLSVQQLQVSRIVPDLGREAVGKQ